MRAELVTIEEPRVIRSYDNIIRREDLKVLFFKGWGEEEFFKNSPIGTKEYEIWQKRFFIDDISPTSIGNVWQPIIDQRMICVIREWLGLAAANLGLRTMREMGNDMIRVMETKDETEKSFSNAFTLQKEAPQALKDYTKER